MAAGLSFGRGVVEAVSVVAAFVGGGLGYADWLDGSAMSSAGEPALYAPALYPGEMENREPPSQVWLVDGYNAIAVGLLARREREDWWTSRYRNELLGRVEAFEEPSAEIWVVFDGARPAEAAPSGRVHSVFAPSADDWLLTRIRERDPSTTTLVTADRQLADRARDRGVVVVTPAEFLARCRAVAESGARDEGGRRRIG
jgi:hypothetical protein